MAGLSYTASRRRDEANKADKHYRENALYGVGDTTYRYGSPEGIYDALGIDVSENDYNAGINRLKDIPEKTRKKLHEELLVENLIDTIEHRAAIQVRMARESDFQWSHVRDAQEAVIAAKVEAGYSLSRLVENPYEAGGRFWGKEIEDRMSKVIQGQMVHPIKGARTDAAYTVFGQTSPRVISIESRYRLINAAPDLTVVQMEAAYASARDDLNVIQDKDVVGLPDSQASLTLERISEVTMELPSDERSYRVNGQLVRESDYAKMIMANSKLPGVGFKPPYERPPAPPVEQDIPYPPPPPPPSEDLVPPPPPPPSHLAAHPELQGVTLSKIAAPPSTIGSEVTTVEFGS